MGTIQTEKKLHCPNCRSHNITITTESSVNSGVTVHHAGHSTTHMSNTHRNFWVCSDCGTKFRNIQSLEEEIQKSKPTPTIALVLAVIGLVIGLYLFIASKTSMFGFFAVFPMILAFSVTIIFFILWRVWKKKLKEMQNELKYLKENCFN